MSSNRQRIQIVRNPVVAGKRTPEQRYWRSFGNTQLVKEHNAVTHITFSPTSPHDIAVTSSTRIQIFSSKTRQVVKTISRFKETAYSGEYRSDGKLLVAGDSSGLVQVFDAHNPRTLLVTIKASSYPTHVTKFHPTIGSHILTASDDKVARLFDITKSDSSLIEFNDHTDYIRSGTYIKEQPHLIATGCYDGFVRIFDTRTNSSKPILKFNHDAPVEDIISVDQTNVVSCGSNYIKVWDLPSNKLTKKLSNFTKTVTCLSLSTDRSLLAGSLDGHVKIYDISELNWQVKFGWKFGSGVLCCGVSPDDRHFVAGLSSGLLSIRTKKSPKALSAATKTKQSDKSNAYAKILRGSEYHGEFEHRIVNNKVKTVKKPQKFEKLLNTFQWSEAFDIAFQTGVPKDVTLTVLGELKSLNKVKIALQNRDEDSLEPFFSWCIKNLDDIKCVDIITDYLVVALSIYGERVEKSLLLEELLVGLKKKVDVEIEKSKEANKISGMLQLLTC